MKTFEVYVVGDYGNRRLITSSQADYFTAEFGTAKFFRKRIFGSDVLLAQINLPSDRVIVADTEFLLAPTPGELFAPLDAAKEAAERFTAEVEPEYCNAGPTPPRRRKSKGSTLGLD